MAVRYSGWHQGFKTTFVAGTRTAGAVPFVQIEPRDANLAAIARGADDSYLRAYADAVAAYHGAVVIGFGQQMNEHEFSWGYLRTSAAVFVQAWRHIVDIFRAQNADNVTWIWTIGKSNATAPPLRDWWPGAGYVTWVGVEGYYDSPASAFAGTIASVRHITEDPVLLFGDSRAMNRAGAGGRWSSFHGALTIIVSWAGLAAVAAPAGRADSPPDPVAGPHCTCRETAGQRQWHPSCSARRGSFGHRVRVCSRPRHICGASDQASVTAIRTWHINAVRIPLNEACWDGESYVDSAYAGRIYQHAVEGYVKLLNANGMVAILDLHWTDGRYTGHGSECSSAQAVCQKPMPDSQRSGSGNPLQGYSRKTTRSFSTCSMSLTQRSPITVTRPRDGGVGSTAAVAPGSRTAWPGCRPWSTPSGPPALAT